MDEPVVITDEAGAREWLLEQNHQTQIWVAARRALRALPNVSSWEDAITNGLALVVCRASLISATASMCPFAEVRNFDAVALSASAAAEKFNEFFTVTDEAARAAAAYSFYAAEVAASATSRYIIFVHLKDIKASNPPKHWRPLFGDLSEIGRRMERWNRLKEQWNADKADWSFWIEWYEGILNGTPLPWELTQRIALEVTKEQWDAGQATVAERIKDIREAWAKTLIQDKQPIEPEQVNPDNVVSLFDKAPIVQASMMSLSEAVSLRVDTFTRMHRPNEAFPLLDVLKSLPDRANRIAKILDQGRDIPDADTALALEIGRLRAEVDQLKMELQAAHADLETLRKKPWYRSASILFPLSVISSITMGSWALSGDDKSLEYRWNKLAEDLEFLSLKVWPEPEDRILEPLRFELPNVDET